MLVLIVDVTMGRSQHEKALNVLNPIGRARHLGVGAGEYRLRSFCGFRPVQEVLLEKPSMQSCQQSDGNTSPPAAMPRSRWYEACSEKASDCQNS